jgi:hypothetical protein
LHPEWYGIFAASSSKIARHSGRRVERLVASDWYRDAQLEKYVLTEAGFERRRWGHDRMVSMGVGDALLGSKADITVVDEPHTVEGAQSTERKRTIAWCNRLAQKADRIVYVGSRLHREDLFGELISQGNATLVLPMECVTRHRSETSIGWVDPRTVDGELLCPELYDRERVDHVKRVLGEESYAAQYQQNPR